MVERQPGRPTVEEFTGAALRFVQDDYALIPVHSQAMMFMNVFEVKVGMDEDIKTIRREAQAEGRHGEYESIMDFATKQLARYRKLKK